MPYMVKISQLMIPSLFLRSEQLCNLTPTASYMVKIAQLMIRSGPYIGVENIVIFAIRAAVSEIQLISTLNGKLSLIGY